MSEGTVAGLRTERIQALCDGVFAVAMTLLILDVRVPVSGLSTAGLQHALLDQRQKVISYVFSFVILGIYWVGHHNQYHYIRRADRTLLWINILFLVTVAFVPFSAALIAEYPRQQMAVVIYGLNLIATGLSLYLHWWYATAQHRLIDPDTPPEVLSQAARRILMAPVAYTLAICLSFVPAMSIVIYILVPLLYILPARFDRHFRSQRRESAQPEVAAACQDGDKVSHIPQGERGRG